METNNLATKDIEKSQGAGWQKRKRPERSGQHIQYNARIGMHSKPTCTPGNVSHTVPYDAIFLPHGTACADFNCAGEARAMYGKPPLSQVPWSRPY